ncbi:MAG: phosphonate ABC transporter, permease protein PhnE [Hyphomicrobiaceae bacterium]
MSESPSLSARTWSRFTPTERIGRWLVYLLSVAGVVWAARTVEIIPEFLADAPEQVVDLFRRMWPIDWAHYYRRDGMGVHHALIETLHMATLGTIIAVVLALPVALLAARNITPYAPLRFVASLILVASRSVNSLVWALLFVAVFGPGPLAGTFAIAFRSIGFVGKLLGEALEECSRGPIEALKASGAPASSILKMGYWPAVRPAFWSIAVFRWDINVRESAILGLVGAGGIGMVIDTALNTFRWDRVAMALIAILTVVVLAEILVTMLRKRII